MPRQAGEVGTSRKFLLRVVNLPYQFRANFGRQCLQTYPTDDRNGIERFSMTNGSRNNDNFFGDQGRLSYANVILIMNMIVLEVVPHVFFQFQIRIL